VCHLLSVVSLSCTVRRYGLLHVRVCVCVYMRESERASVRGLESERDRE